jgi:small subunit ribosomal protein S17
MAKKKCTDKNCPVHGTLSTRGRVLEGVVISDKMHSTVVIRRDYVRYVPKYERYKKASSRISAHNPECISAKVGDSVKIAECRPLSKTKNFVVVEVL